MPELRVGVTLPQFTSDPRVLTDAIVRAEDLGLDSIWAFDHLWPLSGGKNRPFMECWTSLCWAAARTKRISAGTLVTRSTLRHPAVIGKLAATAASIAPGRITIGIGSGDEASRDENEAFGIDYHSGDDRIAQFRAAVESVRHFLSSSTVDHDSGFTSLSSLPATPEIQPRPQVWVAGRSDDALQLAGELGDAWNGWGGTPGGFAADAARVRAAAGERDIAITWAGVVSPEVCAGGAEAVAAKLSGFVEAGASEVILTMRGAGEPRAYELAAEVRRQLRGGS
ncbi:MAG TPA: LLM class flavin-dependent oxidoreductase [Actinomycetota bacterium]|nr:LLM class flavin-dependent oxidoreductase [Actinomycetota bacterium]